MATLNSLKRVEVFPSNRANNSNIWSYKDGNPTLVFNFGVQDLYLLSNTLRLNFRYRVRTDTETVPGVPEYPTNNLAGGIENVLNNEMVNVCSAISSITLANSSNQVLEYVRSYPRLLASLIPAGASWGDFSTYLQQYFGATANVANAGQAANHEQEVSMPLMCGMFLNGEAIPIGLNGTAGLQIRITLSPSIEANYGANAQGSYFQLVNPSLTCALGVPESGSLPKIAAMPYNSFSSFYNVVQNSDETHNINAGLSRVVSVINNFVPTAHIANNTQDGNRTQYLRNGATAAANGQICPITRYTTLRAGLKFPYQFTVDEQQNLAGNSSTAPAFQGTNYPAQLQRNFLSAVKPLSQTTETICGLVSENALSTGANIELNPYNTAGQSITGVGCRYDQLGTGAGADFKTRTYAHRLQSRLDGNSPNSVYTFMLHKNMINYNNQGGISVAN